MLAILAAGAIIGCASPTLVVPQSPQPPASIETQQPPVEASTVAAIPSEPGWTTVKSFSGQESTTTPAFYISGSKWRFVWTVDAGDPKYTVFNVLVFREDSANAIIGSSEYSSGVASDVFEVSEGGHDYYLKIISSNLNKWTIDIEEYGAETGDQPVQITEVHYLGMNYNDTIALGHTIVEWDEYVEIHNFSDSPQNLVGWTLIDITKGAPTFIFPMFTPCSCTYEGSWSKCVKECYPKRPCTIAPRESIRVYTGDPQWESGGYCFYYYPGNIWDNVTPDTAVLYNAEGQEVSSRSYTIIPGKHSVPNYSTPL